MATSQYVRFPFPGNNLSVGLTGSTAPASATELGAVFGGNLVALTADSLSNLNVNVAVSALPSGAATSALQITGNTSLASIDGKTPALGQALAAGSVPVVLTAAQISTLTPLSTVTANQGTANATPWNENISQINGVTPLMGNGITGTGSLRVTIASDNTAFSVNAVQSGTWNITNISGTISLPTGAATEATLAAASAKLPATLGQKVMSASLAVAIASDQSTLPTKETVSATSTLSNVASSVTSVTLLASNANRLGAMFFNDSTQVLYLKFGATASSSSYTVQLIANAYYELPTAHLYTGIIDGIWASANGNCRVTELT